MYLLSSSPLQGFLDCLLLAKDVALSTSLGLTESRGVHLVFPEVVPQFPDLLSAPANAGLERQACAIGVEAQAASLGPLLVLAADTRNLPRTWLSFLGHIAALGLICLFPYLGIFCLAALPLFPQLVDAELQLLVELCTRVGNRRLRIASWRSAGFSPLVVVAVVATLRRSGSSRCCFAFSGSSLHDQLCGGLGSSWIQKSGSRIGSRIVTSLR
mmetsp:Transcript_15507/g.24807  ORF Transcript_15507/g.24807 Transcript_15507/m.24807 type:complete len:214 (-) Transcript_15507:221-862(-)